MRPESWSEWNTLEREKIQACFTLLHSADKCVLYKFKICGNSELNKSIGTILSNSISSVHVSVSHFGNSYNIFKINFSVQFSSIALSCPTLCDPMDCCTQGSPVHHQFPEPTQTHVHWVGDAIQPSHPLCRPLLLPPSVFPSIRVFSNEPVLCIRWPKYWSFIFSISASNEYSGLIFFSTDWFGLLAVQGTLKSLLQHHSSKVSILWCLLQYNCLQCCILQYYFKFFIIIIIILMSILWLAEGSNDG